jgi:hypothetical protein
MRGPRHLAQSLSVDARAEGRPAEIMSSRAMLKQDRLIEVHRLLRLFQGFPVLHAQLNRRPTACREHTSKHGFEERSTGSFAEEIFR